MPLPTETLWRREPHTEAKHQILKGYLQAWWPIFLQTNWVKRLTVLDGFAGPGEYSDVGFGRPEGSPCVAIRTLLEFEHLIGGRPISFLFVEADPRRAKHLEDLLRRKFPTLPRSVEARVECGTCEDVAEGLLTEAHAWGSPIFANLDTWKIGDIPYLFMARIARNQSSELLATFLPGWFRRFGDIDEAQVLRLGAQQFASETWERALALRSNEREQVLVDEYQTTLKKAGIQFALPFALSNLKDSTLYLIYGTSSRVGVGKMKDAMWKIDPVKGTSFKDPRDPNQLELGFKVPDLTALRAGIVQALRRNAPQTVEAIQSLFFPTMYKVSHVNKALRALRDEGLLVRRGESKAQSRSRGLAVLAATDPKFVRPRCARRL